VTATLRSCLSSSPPDRHPGRTAISAPTLDPRIGPQDHIQGFVGAKVSLLEYGDFECPYCQAAFPVINDVRHQMGDKMVFAFRHFPLASIHPHAIAAALAAEAAALVQRFWQMHYRLYKRPNRLTQPDLRRHAEAIGVDPDTVVWPATRLVEDRVEADFNSGVRSGVRGTPTLFINGRPYDGAVRVPELLEAVRAELPAMYR
jgi:protein-disulfide isomerase